MSLNWDVRDCDQDVVWFKIDSAEDAGASNGWVASTMEHDGQLYAQTGTTYTLIMMTMALGMPGIDARTLPEFKARLALWQACHGGLLQGPDGDVNVTPEDVERHLGLRVNVALETRSKWIKRMFDDLAQAAVRSQSEVQA